MNELMTEVKHLLIECLNLEDVTVDDIDNEAPLFGSGLGLDSIDALEIAVALQKKYGLKLESSSQETRQHFRSIRTLSAFVAASRVKS